MRKRKFIKCINCGRTRPILPKTCFWCRQHAAPRQSMRPRKEKKK